MEEKLAAGLGEGQIAAFVEDDEAFVGEMVGHAALTTVHPSASSFPMGRSIILSEHKTGLIRT